MLGKKTYTGLSTATLGSGTLMAVPMEMTDTDNNPGPLPAPGARPPRLHQALADFPRGFPRRIIQLPVGSPKRNNRGVMVGRARAPSYADSGQYQKRGPATLALAGRGWPSRLDSTGLE